MQILYILNHTIVRGGEADRKKIGMYTSEGLANHAIERTKNKPGFKDPRGFFTLERRPVRFRSGSSQIRLDSEEPETQFQNNALGQYVFTLYYKIERGDEESWKEIGIYASEELAELTMAQLKDSSEFQDADGEFIVSPCEIDFDYWQEGFVRVDGFGNEYD